ncbi:MAG: proline racemase family protein [Terrimesophilobacter sp.]
MCHITEPIRTVDFHTAGEPFRIVADGVPLPDGPTVAARRILAQKSDELEAVRQLLCREPRGHADMYGCFVVPPDDDGADFGVLFWHNHGYSTACGHGTIALGVWAVQSGRVVSDPDGDTDVTIDVPSGRVVARVRRSGGEVIGVTFRNVPSYVIATGVSLSTSRGTVPVDLSYSGAIYVSVPAEALGLAVTPEHYADLIAIGREIKWALNDSEWAQHPSDARLSGVYGTILYDDLGDTDAGPHQRNATVFADGEVDRSPCGSGTGARVALLAAAGRLGPHQEFTHDSIIGTRFTARAIEHPDGVIPEVEGMAYRTGEHVFHQDSADPIGTGFVLR